MRRTRWLISGTRWLKHMNTTPDTDKQCSHVVRLWFLPPVVQHWITITLPRTVFQYFIARHQKLHQHDFPAIENNLFTGSFYYKCSVQHHGGSHKMLHASHTKNAPKVGAGTHQPYNTDFLKCKIRTILTLYHMYVHMSVTHISHIMKQLLYFPKNIEYTFCFQTTWRTWIPF